jgi:hypothetical protein
LNTFQVKVVLTLTRAFMITIGFQTKSKQIADHRNADKMCRRTAGFKNAPSA